MAFFVSLKHKAEDNGVEPTKTSKLFSWVCSKLATANAASQQDEQKHTRMNVIGALKRTCAELRVVPKTLHIIFPFMGKAPIDHDHSAAVDEHFAANAVEHKELGDANDETSQGDGVKSGDADDEGDAGQESNAEENSVCKCTNCRSKDKKLRFGSVLDIEDSRLLKVALLHLGAEKGDECSVERRTGGTFNRAHIIKFSDGSKYIIRVPCCGRPGIWTDDDAVGFRSDVLTLRYIKRHTGIPVPDILAYSTTCDNELGHPYMLMSFLEGIPAYCLWHENSGSAKNDAWRRTMLKSLANTLSKLQNLRFAAGGRLHFENDDDITPEIAPAYVDDGYDLHDPNHGLKHCAFFDPIEHDPKEHFKALFKKWVARAGKYLEGRMDEPGLLQLRYAHRLILKMLVNSIAFPGDAEEDDALSLISDRGGCCYTSNLADNAQGGEEVEAGEGAEDTEVDKNDQSQDSKSGDSSVVASVHDDSSIALAETDTKATSLEGDANLGYVLAHTDLGLQNIFVNEDGEVVGIIDWDQMRTKRVFQGWVGMPSFLKADWMQTFVDGEPPKAWIWNGNINWTPDHLEYYRELYAKYVREACGDNGEWVYCAKSHIFDAIEEALLYQDRTEGVVDMILRTVLPPRIDIEQFLLRIVDDDSGFNEGEYEWLKARFKELLACKLPAKAFHRAMDAGSCIPKSVYALSS